mmetsp:Transcript_26107/g.60263  ORF Transcript_26107/g.60263 Transcript_26107/m.60263 type:complete len:519 (-) Transcript_26107:26-1582(-)
MWFEGSRPMNHILRTSSKAAVFFSLCKKCRARRCTTTSSPQKKFDELIFAMACCSAHAALSPEDSLEYNGTVVCHSLAPTLLECPDPGLFTDLLEWLWCTTLTSDRAPFRKSVELLLQFLRRRANCSSWAWLCQLSNRLSGSSELGQCVQEIDPDQCVEWILWHPANHAQAGKALTPLLSDPILGRKARVSFALARTSQRGVPAESVLRWLMASRSLTVADNLKTGLPSALASITQSPGVTVPSQSLLPLGKQLSIDVLQSSGLFEQVQDWSSVALTVATASAKLVPQLLQLDSATRILVLGRVVSMIPYAATRTQCELLLVLSGLMLTAWSLGYPQLLTGHEAQASLHAWSLLTTASEPTKQKINSGDSVFGRGQLERLGEGASAPASACLVSQPLRQRSLAVLGACRSLTREAFPSERGAEDVPNERCRGPDNVAGSCEGGAEDVGAGYDDVVLGLLSAAAADQAADPSIRVSACAGLLPCLAQMRGEVSRGHAQHAGQSAHELELRALVSRILTT